MVRCIPILLLLSILLLSVSMLAQESKDEPQRTTALTFSFDGFDLDPTNGGIGGKYWFSDNMVINGGIRLNRFSKTLKAETEVRTDEEEISTTGGFFGGGELHMQPGNRVSPYIGGQVSFSRTALIYKPSVLKDPLSGTTLETENSTSTIGFFGVIGVEYWVSKSISLSGQHIFGFEFGSSKIKKKSKSDTGTDTIKSAGPSSTNIGFGTSSLIILAIYF